MARCEAPLHNWPYNADGELDLYWLYVTRFICAVINVRENGKREVADAGLIPGLCRLRRTIIRLIAPSRMRPMV